MEKYRTAILLAGPILYCLAMFIQPGDNADAEARIGIIRACSMYWQLGHVLAAVSLLGPSVFIADVYGAAMEGDEWQAFWGAALSGLAIIARYASAMFQLVGFDLLQLSPEDAQRVLELMDASGYLTAFVTVPIFGFVIGFGLFAMALVKAGRSLWQPAFLFNAGLFTALATVLNLQFMHWIGGSALLAFAWLHVNMPLSQER